jgi:Protein of unknown function (DUF2924)
MKRAIFRSFAISLAQIGGRRTVWAIERRMASVEIAAMPEPKELAQKKAHRGLAAWRETSNVCLCPWRRTAMEHRFSGPEAEQIPQQIAALFGLKVSELKDRWRSLYGVEPPPRSSRKLLIAAIAYRVQEQTFGGLKPSVVRLLERASGDAGGRPILRTRPVTRASIGTVLIRDWRGKSHHVTVLDQGVLYRKKNYRSLSQVARVITGCRWSGPLFFGLKDRVKEGSRGTR